MDVGILDAAGQALLILLDPYRLVMLSGGVLIGLVLGIIPGIGSLVGMSLLLPFSFSMDPYTAFAVLLGMVAVNGTSDTIPAVLFGVPGSAGAQATVMDGNPMAKKGEAGRALAAAYTASLIGGVFGALMLGLTVPVLRPVMLHIQSPELLALSIFGISMVAVVAGSAPLRGLVAACLGILLSMIGSDPQTSTLRWTMGDIYLWDGLPLGPMVLGLFALPELADMAVKRMAITKEGKIDVAAGMWQGVKDALTNWWLVLRCGGIGAALGAVPGIGSSVVDWLAYGHALQTCKGADKTFGTGDVRGVIAPESANNSITAGSLVPTVAFGVPGSAPMALLLGAFLVHGLTPGPDMLAKNLTVTYSMVWSIAIANIMGAGICFLFSGQLARIALLRYTLILPAVLVLVYIGAYQASSDWGDLYALLIFGVIGWIMRQLRWPRPPLLLGFVLGAIIERYMFISIELHGWSWLLRPLVVIALAGAALSVLKPFLQDVRIHGGFRKMASGFRRPTFRIGDLFYVLVIGFVAVLLIEAANWRWAAKVGPMIIGGFALFVAVVSFGTQLFRRPGEVPVRAAESGENVQQKIHMDTGLDLSDLSVRTALTRTGIFFGWLLFIIASMAVIGIIPTTPLFVILYMRLEGGERWPLVLTYAGSLTAFVYVVFHVLLKLNWPGTLLGQLFPLLQVIPSM